MLQVKERRRPRRRLTTSHSRKTERPHRLYPPALVLTPQRKNERKDRPPFEEKTQDVQPPSFDFSQRSKEGDKDVAPPEFEIEARPVTNTWFCGTPRYNIEQLSEIFE